jgi:hypothetical protein
VRLEGEVELLVGHLVEVLDHPGGVEQVAGAGAVDQPGQAVHHPQVAVHALGDGRPLDLEHRLPTVPQHARVDLGDRGRRQRHRVEAGQQVGGGRAEVVLHDGERLAGRERRHVVERAQAGVGQRRREGAGRRGDHLAQLHERGAEGHERLDQAHADRRAQAPAGGAEVAGDVHDHGAGDVGGQDRPDLHAPQHLPPAEAGQAGRHHPQRPGRRTPGERPRPHGWRGRIAGHPLSMSPPRAGAGHHGTPGSPSN